MLLQETGNSAERNKRKYVTYRCTNHNKGEKCKCKEVNKEYLENFVLDLLLETVLSVNQEKVLLTAFQEYQSVANKEYFEKMKNLRAEKSSKEVEIENLLVQLDKGIATNIILQRIEQKQEEITSINIRISEFEANVLKVIDEDAFSALMTKARSVIRKKESPDIREWLCVFIKKIKINKDDITIVLTLENVVSLVGGGEGN